MPGLEIGASKRTSNSTSLQYKQLKYRPSSIIALSVEKVFPGLKHVNGIIFNNLMKGDYKFWMDTEFCGNSKNIFNKWRYKGL